MLMMVGLLTAIIAIEVISMMTNVATFVSGSMSALSIFATSINTISILATIPNLHIC